MKHLIFLILVGFTLSLSAQEIARLDSVVYNELTGETAYTLSFEYNAEERLAFVNNLEGEIDFSFTYNDDGTIDIFTIIGDSNDPDPLEYKYVYDLDGELDSMNAYIFDDGYEGQYIIDIQAEAGMVQRATIAYISDGYTFQGTDKKFTYTTDGQLDSIIFFDVYGYSGADEVETIINHEYVDGKLISRAYQSIYYSAAKYKDSIGYFADGATQFIDRIGGPLDVYPELKIEYSSAVNFEDGELIGPLVFFELASNIFSQEYLDILIPLGNNSRPTSHIEEGENLIIEGTWYYTILVNTDENEIPATAISVYPNPTSDLVQVSIDNEIYSMELYSMTGELLMNQATQERTLNIQDFSAGNYLLIVKASNGQNYFSKIKKF